MKHLIPQFSKSWVFRTKLAAIFAVVLTFASCSPFSGRDEGSTTIYRIPFPDETGHYSLQLVDIPSYREPKSLLGDFATILVNPHEGPSGIESSKPVGRYVQTGAGVMVPADPVSMMAAAIQAHMERLRALNSRIGLGDEVISWPVKIGVEVNVFEPVAQKKLTDNALFESRLGALLVVPYLAMNLPIAVNGGVLAHENFHRTFQSLVLNQIQREKKPEPGTSDEYNETFLRALNEGLADFLAWVYTGDADFISQSLPAEGRPRSLTPMATPFCTAEDLQHWLPTFTKGAEREMKRINRSYHFGTRYARFLKELTKTAFSTTSRESRERAAGAVIRALPALAREAERARAQKVLLSEYVLLSVLEPEIRDSPEVADLFKRMREHSSDGAGCRGSE